MNWLIYIGGYLVVYIISSIIVRTLFTNEVSDEAFYFWAVVPSGLIWIWICWKFIR